MASNKNNPNYYAIIPASVRYDNDLPPLARLLYAEISALSNQAGFCWATNKYFATLFESSARSISSLIGQLSDRGHIVVDLTTVGTRNIYLAEAIAENFHTPSKKLLPPLEESFLHNTKTNNKSNISSVDEATDSHDSGDIRKIYHLYLKWFKITDYQKATVEERQALLTTAEKKYKLTPKRRDAIKRRLDDAGLEMLATAIVGYAGEPWYQGDNDRGWTADLEKFICRSYEKVEEGAAKYEKSQTSSKKTNDPWS